MLFVRLEPELQAAQHEVQQLRQEVQKVKKYGKKSFMYFKRTLNRTPQISSHSIVSIIIRMMVSKPSLDIRPYSRSSCRTPT